jgi:hypothetical protein
VLYPMDCLQALLNNVRLSQKELSKEKRSSLFYRRVGDDETSFVTLASSLFCVLAANGENTVPEPVHKTFYNSNLRIFVIS